jgi:cell division protein FtsW
MSRQTGTIDYPLLAIACVLALFGLVMLMSASSASGYANFSDSYYFVKHQIIFGLIPGIGLLLAFARIPYGFWRKHAWTLLIISVVLLVLVFIPGLSAGIGSAHSWISIGNIFSLQPSEIVKLTFLFYLCAWLAARDRHSVRNIHAGLIPFLFVLGAIALLMILQPDIGTMSVIAAMSLVVYFAAGAPFFYVLGFLAAGFGALALLISVAPYRAARLTTFMHPELDPQGIGYHINQALLALGSGGVFGLGYGHSRQKFQYLPEVSGDSIFAVIGEEMGFLVAILVIAMFLFLFWRALKIAQDAPDTFGKYLAIGIGAWITIQALVNVASIAALMPMTGIPLPFISYGGTSLAICLGAIGVLLSVSRGRG